MAEEESQVLKVDMGGKQLLIITGYEGDQGDLMQRIDDWLNDENAPVFIFSTGKSNIKVELHKIGGKRRGRKNNSGS
jgi:hypothetical protein